VTVENNSIHDMTHRNHDPAHSDGTHNDGIQVQGGQNGQNSVCITYGGYSNVPLTLQNNYFGPQPVGLRQWFEVSDPDLLQVEVHHLRSVDQPLGGQQRAHDRGRNTGIRFMSARPDRPRDPRRIPAGVLA
jgi:hypothetical protein